MIFEYEGGVSQVYTPEAISKLIIVNANVNNVLIWRNHGENLALYTINEESLEEITNLLFKHMSMIGVKNKAHYVEPYDIPIDSYTFLLPTPNEHDDYYVDVDSMHLSEKNPVIRSLLFKLPLAFDALVTRTVERIEPPSGMTMSRLAT